MNKIHTLILVSIFFIIAFCGTFFLQKNKNLATEILREIPFLAETSLREVKNSPHDNPTITKKINSLPVQITYYRTQNTNRNDPYNFVGAFFKDVSPLMCHFIIKNKKAFQARLFINNQETFFRSDSSICFENLKNDIRLYFELYNYLSYYNMSEPKLCFTKKDCEDESSSCINGYCKKNNK